MTNIAIIGCGFVADLYMRSFASFPNQRISGVFDTDPARLAQFCDYWKLDAAQSQHALLEHLPTGSIVLNLTNPRAHSAVNRAILNAGHHVYSEKPLALELSDAEELHDLARQSNLHLASAPCSVLGEAAQTLAKAARERTAGDIRLIYAELDDGFIPQAPYQDWKSESGAPWPYEDEFHVGCTLEHAGYYLSWLIAMFGPVVEVIAASAETIPDKPGANGTADFSVATLFFARGGPPVRLTCSITAPHDHRIRMIGDKGVLSVKKAWANSAPVRFNKRMVLRRRLLEHPIGKRIKLGKPSHPKVKRWGAAEMNFALGPMEMAEAIEAGRAPRLAGDFALHLNEVTLAIQHAGRTRGVQQMNTSCDVMEPMPWAR
ncbi:MAG: Gfo/Idh/MocA family oxidoreductase [Planktotalea sp.]|uniref:Gfo/Idh/MocA family protein n=1 Tax=Planktotalea sp. TaxID=2029877 RepID=UPI003C7595D0